MTDTLRDILPRALEEMRRRADAGLTLDCRICAKPILSRSRASLVWVPKLNDCAMTIELAGAVHQSCQLTALSGREHFDVNAADVDEEEAWRILREYEMWEASARLAFKYDAGLLAKMHKCGVMP